MKRCLNPLKLQLYLTVIWRTFQWYPPFLSLGNYTGSCPWSDILSLISLSIYLDYLGTLLIDCIAAGKLFSKTFLIWIDSVWWLASDQWSKSRVDWYQDLYMTAFVRPYSKSISDDDVAMSANFRFRIFYFFW